jgi:hypothetical protein
VKGRTIAVLISLLACTLTLSESCPAEVRAAVAAPLAVDGPTAIYSNTSHVEAMAAHGNTLWVATRGGLEEYDILERTRSRLYSTRDGLPNLFVVGVRIAKNGLPTITTAQHECAMHRTLRRFACSPRTTSHNAAPTPIGSQLEGSPVTAHWTSSDGTDWLGTADLGLWVRSGASILRLTPTDQVAGNHVVAISEWAESAWFATFDQGLSRYHAGHFTAAALGPRFLNDVIATDHGLFVATSEGLFVSHDGEAFQRDRRITERFVTDLAYDATRHFLFATAMNSLWQIALDNPRAQPLVTYQPGGSRSLQAVDVSNDGTVFLASEDRGAMRRKSGKHFVGFDRLAGYPSSWAVDILALGGNSALVGTLRHGVFPLGGANPVTSQLDPWILFLGRDTGTEGTLFVGTQGGAMVVDAAGSRALAGLPNPCVHAVARLSSGLWVGTEGGLARY